MWMWMDVDVVVVVVVVVPNTVVLSQSTRCLPPGEGLLPKLGRVTSTRTSPLLPWPSSVPVGLSGVAPWPRPQRSTAARAATRTACAAEQLLCKTGDAQRSGHAWKDARCCCSWLFCRWLCGVVRMRPRHLGNFADASRHRRVWHRHRRIWRPRDLVWRARSRLRILHQLLILTPPSSLSPTKHKQQRPQKSNWRSCIVLTVWVLWQLAKTPRLRYGLYVAVSTYAVHNFLYPWRWPVVLATPGAVDATEWIERSKEDAQDLGGGATTRKHCTLTQLREHKREKTVSCRQL